MISIVGCVCILTCFAVLRTIYRLFLLKPNLEKYKKRNSWAVVTGASDGIGLGFVKVLASNGFNVLLVSQTESKLRLKIEELEKGFEMVRFDYHVSNATDLSSIEKLVVKCASLDDLAILVNNVGIGQGTADYLENLPTARLEDMVTVNCTYPLLLTHKLLPIIKRRQHPSAILNISSVTAHLHYPFGATYAATKAFNRSFSLSLSGECASSNIDVISVEPGWVATNMTQMSKGLLVCDPEECASGALQQLGYLSAIPHWKHWIMLNGIRFVAQWLCPERFQAKLMHNVMVKVANRRYNKKII